MAYFDVDKALQSGASQEQINDFMSQNSLQPLPKNSNTQKPKKSPFSSGVLGLATESLPIIGGIAGGALGGLAGGGFASAVTGMAGAGAGSALGETIKEKLRGEKLKPEKIGTEGAYGLVGEGIGRASLPLIKAGGKLITKLPVIGPFAEGISKTAESSLGKIFGAGDEATLKSGVKLSDTAQEYGLHKLNNYDDILQSAQRSREMVGSRLDSALKQADKVSTGITLNDAKDLIKQSLPASYGDDIVKSEQSAQKTLRELIQKDIESNLGRSVDQNERIKILQQIDSGEYRIKPSLINIIKQKFASSGGLDNPIEKFNSAISGKFKTAVEENVPQDIKKINRDWWNLRQIEQNAQKRRISSSKPIENLQLGKLPIGGITGQRALYDLAKTTGVSLKTAQKIAPQLISRMGKPSELPDISNKQFNEINYQSPIQETNKIESPTPYTSTQLLNGYYKAVQSGDNASANKLKSMYQLQLGYEKSNKDTAKVQQDKINTQNIINSLEEIKDFSDKNLYSIINPLSNEGQYIRTKTDLVTQLLAKLVENNRISDQDRKFYLKQTSPNALDLTIPGRYSAKLKGVIDSLKSKIGEIETNSEVTLPDINTTNE